jgi:ATP synthase protein I
MIMPEAPKGSNPPTGQLSPEERAEFERRSQELGAKLGKVQGKKQDEIEAQQDRAMQSRGMAYGLRMSSELVAAILVGGLIGYGLDQWLGTTPWLFLAFFIAGFAAGVLNVTRAFSQMQGEISRTTGGDIGKPGRDDDDD